MPILYRKILASSWLGRLYRTDKVVFAICGLFFSASIFSNLIRLQSTPFFVWSMYSLPVQPQESYSYYRIIYNDGHVINLRHTWNEPEKTYLLKPLNCYAVWMQTHGAADPALKYLDDWSRRHPRFAGLATTLSNTAAAREQFPAWLERYISGITGEPVYSLCVLKKQVHFDAADDLREFASDTVLYIH